VLEDVTLSLHPGASAGGASFAHADLAGGRLTDTDLRGASFRGARLCGADLRRSNLSGTDFSGADLTDADLSGTVVEGATFDGACLTGARLPGGKSIEDLQGQPPPADLSQNVLGKCMRAFAAVPATSYRTRLRVLARRAPSMRREEALDLILPIIEREEVVEQCAEEAVAALRALGSEPSSRPFLVGLLFRGADEVRLEAASVLATPPLDEETVDLFESCLTSEELSLGFRLGVFRSLAPAVEDRDEGALTLARGLLDAGHIFDGELIAALGQAGVTDTDYLEIIEDVALDRDRPPQARLAAARDIAERFFSPATCARLAELLSDDGETPSFRRDVFWFLSRRVTSGDPDAGALARKLLGADADLEADIRWALAESGDSSQAPFFLKVVRGGVEHGWGPGPVDGEAPSYDDLVRAAQVLGRIGTTDAIQPLAALIRREKSAGGPPPGEPFSLTDSAREAILELRKSTAESVPSEVEGEMPPPMPAETCAETAVISAEAGQSHSIEGDEPSPEARTETEGEGESMSGEETRPEGEEKGAVPAGDAEASGGESEDEAARRRAEEDEARRRADEEEEARRKAEDEEEARRKAGEEEEAQRRAEEEEARRKAEEEESRRKAEEAEAQRKAEEDEARRKAEEADTQRKAEEAEARRKAEEEEARRKAEEAKAQRKAEEDEARRKAEEADTQRKAEEAEARRKAEEEEARRKAEEAEAQRKAEEAEARRKAEEEEVRRRAEEAEALRRAEEEEARRKAEEEESRRRAEEEEARRKAEEEESRRRAEEEEARRKAEEAEALRKAEEEETRRKAEEEAAAAAKAAQKKKAAPKKKAAKKKAVKKKVAKKKPAKKAAKKKAAKKKVAKKAKKKAKKKVKKKSKKS
jgi:hypothetical protein